MHLSQRMLAALLAAAALLTASSAADASTTVRSQQARAASVMHHLDSLQAQRDTAAQRELMAKARLTSARMAVTTTEAELASSRHNLSTAQEMLARSIVVNYKVGNEDSVAYVLAAGSFSDLLARVDVLRRAASVNTNLIDQISSDQRAIEVQELSEMTALQQASAAAADATHARQQLDTAIAAGRAVLARVDAGIRTLLAGERARRAKLASHDGSGGGSTASSGSRSSGGGDSGGGGNSNVFYGDCTWYGPGFAGHHTADGEIFDPNALTAASPWLPFNTELLVTNPATGRSVQVRVNDRGPFGRGVLDLSAHAARIVGLNGWQRVRIQILPGSARPAQLTP